MLTLLINESKPLDGLFANATTGGIGSVPDISVADDGQAVSVQTFTRAAGVITDSFVAGDVLHIGIGDGVNAPVCYIALASASPATGTMAINTDGMVALFAATSANQLTLNVGVVRTRGAYTNTIFSAPIVIHRSVIDPDTAVPTPSILGTGVYAALQVAINTALGFVRLDSSARLPAVDGSQLTNVPNELPSQTGNSGKYLTTNGTATSWGTVSTGLTVGTTAIASGTTGRILYDNAGVLGELPVGTGVATALAVNVGSAGAFITLNGDAGTPSTLIGTNISGTAASLTAGLVSSIGNLTGDVTSSNRSTTLATVNANVGAFTNASLTVNAKGLVTAASSGTSAVTSITGTANEITVTGTTTPTLSLPSAITFTGKTVTGGTFNSPTLFEPSSKTYNILNNQDGTMKGRFTNDFTHVYLDSGGDVFLRSTDFVSSYLTLAHFSASTGRMSLGYSAFLSGKIGFKNATSTGTTTLDSANASANDYTATLQAATGTLALVSGNLGTPSAIVLTNATGTAASLTAGNATKWTTGRTIALTGDVTYTSGALDGSGNVTGTATLANIPAISGANLTGTAASLTAGNVTTNANLTGHVTSVGNAAVLGSFTMAQLSTAVSDGDPAYVGAANTFTTGQTISATTSLLLGTAGSAVGNVGFRNATSGTTTLAPPTGALGTGTVTLPLSGTLATLDGTETLTNKSIVATQLTGTIADARNTVSNTTTTSLANLVTVGTLTGGATGAGFTVALSTSTITGNLPDARNTVSNSTTTTLSGLTSETITTTPAANTAGTALLITDTTAATSGNQQYSGAIRWTGQGWKTTATAASQAVDWRAYVVPVQGAANPTSILAFDVSANGGAFANALTVTSTGTLTTARLNALSGSFDTIYTQGSTLNDCVVSLGSSAADGVCVRSLGNYCFTSTSVHSQFSARDTSISRSSAGVISFDTTTNNNKAGSWTATNGTLSGTLAVTAATTLSAALITTPEALAPALNAGAACGVTTVATGFALNGVNALTLANGTNGQIKTIVCTAVTAAGTATLTPTTCSGFTTVAFTAAGQTLTLQYFTTGGWVILSVRGATPA